MNDAFCVVIPARYQSDRLPGKPLADIGGIPMVVRVAQRAAESAARKVIVATDHERIYDVVRAAGFTAVMTASNHPSGSDRVMEAAQSAGWSDGTVVVNVQGDEPLIPPAAIDQVAACLHDDAGRQVATLCEPLIHRSELLDPNVVKVVRSNGGAALYFSRAPIPFDRERAHDVASGGWERHVGVYAYRVGALRRFVQLPPGRLEVIERLEQLRLLEHGMSIHVATSCVSVPPGVDTPEDLARIRQRFG